MKPLHKLSNALCGVRSSLGVAGVAALVLPFLVQPAVAQDFRSKAGDFTVRLGVAGVLFDPSASFELAGQDLADADLELTDAVTAALELEYYLLPSFSVTLNVGVPPETEVDGTGALEAVGRLGDVRYGLAAVVGRYHLDRWGRFQPFVGAGVGYFAVFDAEGVGIDDLEVEDSFAPVIQAGADFMATERFGVYASVTHAFLDTEGEGTFAGFPVTADIELDPTVVQAGFLVRF